VSRLAEEARAAALAAELSMMADDIDAGRLPPDANRSLYGWEIQAQTNFAGIADDQARFAAAVAARLQAARAGLLELLEADLAATAEQAGPVPPRVAVLNRLLALDGLLGLQALSGASTLVDTTATDLRTILGAAAAAGFSRLLDEAERQGVDVASRAVKLGGEAEFRLDATTGRLAVEPHGDLLEALLRQGFMEPLTGPATDLISALLGAGRAMSPKVLDVTSRGPVNSATGLGRQAAASTLTEPKEVYASELLDQNTCGPCSMIDGHAYADLADGLADYPNGQYADCEGGERCRGTLVFVWSQESTPEH
jgi:hypothetical protein